MSRVQFGVLLAAATLASFAGGAASNRMITAQAQQRMPDFLNSESFKGKEFLLLDETGRKRGEFSMRAGPVLRLYDEQGRVIWRAQAGNRRFIVPAGPTE